MSDPISVRHVIASGDYSERIQKTEAVQDQALREHFTKEMERQERLKRTQVNESDDSEEVRIREEEKQQRREEKRRKAAAKESEEEEATEEPKESEEHIIDLRA